MGGVVQRVFPAERSPYILSFGLLAIVSAQLIFGLTDQTHLPGSGVFAILVGIGAIALWARLTGGFDIPHVVPSAAPRTEPRVHVDGSRRRPFMVVCSAVGSLAAAVLLFRVLSGHGNTWDIALWLVSIAAVAALFLPARDWCANWTIPSRLTSQVWRVTCRHWREWAPLAAILIVYCTVTIPNLTAWRYAVLGDEYLFFEHARHALESGTTTPFSQDGVYEHHPVLNTLYTAGWMQVFGADHFGWKMTGVVSMVLSVTGLYVLGRLIDGRVTALAAGVLFAASHYLIGILHGGYNHLDALPVTLLALILFVSGIKQRNPLLLFLSGIAVGFGFYFHYSARIVGPVMLLTAAISIRPRNWSQLWPVLLGGFVSAWPTLLLAKGEILTKMFAQTPAGYSEVVSGPVAERLLSNLRLNLPAFHFNSTSHTYVSGPLLDPITGALSAIGTGMAIGTMRGFSAKLCLIWLLVAFIATGITSPYPTTAITRIYPMVPPLVLLAGLAVAAGYSASLGWLSRLRWRTAWLAAPVGLACLWASVVAVNQHQALVNTHETYHYTHQALATGALRSEHCGGQVDSTIFVGVHPDSTLRKAIESYDPDGPAPNVVPYEEFSIDTPIPNLACVVILNTRNNDSLRVMAALERKYPTGSFYTYTTPSRKSSVEFFHIPPT